MTAKASVNECLLMKVSCEACGKVVPARDVNLENLVAKCSACDAVFSIAGKLRDKASRRLQSGRRCPTVFVSCRLDAHCLTRRGTANLTISAAGPS